MHVVEAMLCYRESFQYDRLVVQWSDTLDDKDLTATLLTGELLFVFAHALSIETLLRILVVGF